MNRTPVCFSYRRNLEDPFISQRAELFLLLRSTYGIEPVVSAGGREALEDGTVLVSPVDDSGLPVLTTQYRVPVQDFKAVVNRCRGALPVPIPVLNEPSVIRYGTDKVLANRELFEPNGIGIETFELHTAQDIERAFNGLPGARVVLKKINGTLTEGLFIEDRDVARRLLEDTLAPAGIAYLLQPAYDFTIAWPDTLRPFSVADAADLERYAGNSNPKELRMYFFYRCDKQTGEVHVECFPVARTSLGGNTYMQLPSQWFCIEPASLPAYVAEKTTAVARSLGSKTESLAIFGCLDWGYGAARGEAPAWVCIEGNFRKPYLLSSDKHPVVGPLLYGKFARLVYHLVT